LFSLDHLNNLRAAEIEKIAMHLSAGARILEIGAGTGQQAAELSSRGFDIEAVEIAASNYANDRVFPISNYDGRRIPFPDASFGVVFSSNVLEHVPDLTQIHREIRRVLKPDGYAVHVLPTHAWRFWTTLSAFPLGVQRASTLKGQIRPYWPFTRREAKRLLTAWYRLAGYLAVPFLFQRRHGERGNVVSETWIFRPEWWRKNFRENGFEIVTDEPMGLFYTGNMVFGSSWDMEKRAQLAALLGSACHIFKLRALR
jgi:SAM-dependent methyltransferase